MKVFLAAVLAIFAIVDPAFAQFSTQATAPTTVDVAPVVNTIIQAVASLITIGVLPLMWAWFRKKQKEWQLEELKIEEQYRKAIDAGAMAAIGSIIARYQVKPGELTLDAKNELVASAANMLAKNFPDAFSALGFEDHVVKAREVIESRLGLTEANAAGTPVVGTETAAAAPTVAVVAPAATQTKT